MKALKKAVRSYKKTRALAMPKKLANVKTSRIDRRYPKSA